MTDEEFAKANPNPANANISGSAIRTFFMIPPRSHECKPDVSSPRRGFARGTL
jgi:hypothetical protein